MMLQGGCDAGGGMVAGTGSFPAHCPPTGPPPRLRPIHPWVRNDSRFQQTESWCVPQIVLGRPSKSAASARQSRFSSHSRASRRAALPSVFGSSVVPPQARTSFQIVCLPLVEASCNDAPAAAQPNAPSRPHRDRKKIPLCLVVISAVRLQVSTALYARTQLGIVYTE